MSTSSATPALQLYARLSALPRPKSYIGKIFLVAFAGTHVPLLSAVLYPAFSSPEIDRALPILFVTLGATLVGTGLTLWMLYRLLAPLRLTADALQKYVDDGTAPDLPTEFADRAGRLMHNTQQTVEKLDAMLQFKNRMLGVVSHDARGPATSILMAADTISKQLDSPDPNVDLVRTLAGRVETAVNYQLDMVRSVLEVARNGEGQITIDRSTGTVGGVVEVVHENLKTHAERREHTFQTEVDAPDLGMHTDLRKIEQILSNLVSNAIKYTPKGGTVTLSATTDEQDVVFRVSDTGKGVPQEARDDLFAAYEGAGSPDADSIGLGLWICKTFTDVLDGTIDVDTGPDGTTFTVRFPKDTLQTDGRG